MKSFSILLFLIFGFSTHAYSQSDKDSIAFRWNFQNFQDLIYSYSNETSAGFSFDKSEEPQNHYLIKTGELKVKSKTNDLADLYFTNQKIKIVEDLEKKSSKDTIIQNAQDVILQGLNVNGTFQNQFHDPNFDLLFSLPYKKLTINETHKVEIKMLFLANGSSLVATGFNQFELSKLESKDNKQIATLNSVFNISDLGLEDKYKDQYEFEISGNGIYVFDVSNGKLISAEIKFSMKTKIDTLDEDKNFGMFGLTNQTGILKLNLIRK